MTNVITKEAVNLRKVLLLMVKIVGSKKPSLLIVIPLAAIQSFAEAAVGDKVRKVW